MKGQWLAKVNDREYGPYTWEQMLQMAAEGRVTPGLPVRRVEDKEWMAAEDVPNLLAAHPSQPVPPPPPVAASLSQASPPPPPPPPPPALARREMSPTKSARLAPVPPPPPPPAADLPIIVTAPPATVESGPRGDDAAPSPGRALWKVGLLLAGVAAAVVLFCASLAAFSWYRHGQAQRAAESHAQSKSTAAVTPASHRTSDEASDKPASAAKDLAAQAKLVKSISTWNSLATLQSFGVGNVRLQVERIWLTDARPAPKADMNTAAKAETSQSQRYVCIQVAISSKVPSPLKYKGWNTTGPTGAILADAKLNVLPLVPISQTPELERHSGGEVPAGGTIHEVLVFAAPQEETDVMYLVLPYKAFYANVRTPYMALELTPDVVGHELSKPKPIAEAGDGTSPADATTAGEVAATAEPAKKEPDKKDPEKKEKLPPPKSLRDQINAEADKKP